MSRTLLFGPAVFAIGLPLISLGRDDSSTAKILRATHWISYAPTHYYPAALPPLMPSSASLTSDLTTLRGAGFDGIITYSSDVEAIPEIAEKLSFRALLLGLWNPWSAIERKSVLSAVAKHRRLIAGIIVGNEGILTGRYQIDALCDAMGDISRRTGKPVSTTEPLDWILGEPRLVECSNFITVNAHPYFSDRRTPGAAVQWTIDAWNAVRGRYPQKPVLFKEVGLPSGGAEGLSETGQAIYYGGLANSQVVFSYFEAFDADPRFKAAPIEQFWGLWRNDRTPKVVVSALPWNRKR
jgi:exo-beta-1,3-glucanase (GH17 family)